MTPLEILQAARQLIEKPEHWTQGCFARDSCGNRVSVYSKEAVAFCASSAVWFSLIVANLDANLDADLDADFGAGGAVAEAARTLGDFADGSASEFNDTHTHAEVLDLFDRAIKERSRDTT